MTPATSGLRESASSLEHLLNDGPKLRIAQADAQQVVEFLSTEPATDTESSQQRFADQQVDAECAHGNVVCSLCVGYWVVLLYVLSRFGVSCCSSPLLC